MSGFTMSYWGGATLTATPVCPDEIEPWSSVGERVNVTPGAVLDRPERDDLETPFLYRDDAIAASARRLLGLPHPLEPQP